MKLIHFEDVIAARNQVTDLINHTGFTQTEQLFRFIQRKFTLPFITAQSGFVRRSLDGEKTFFVADADSHRTSSRTANISLPDPAATFRLRPVRRVGNQKLTFYFLHRFILSSNLQKQALGTEKPFGGTIVHPFLNSQRPACYART
jgi:hypothetical protein